MFSADILYIPVLLFFLTAAALYDALYRKIPNCLILGALFTGGFLLGPPFLIRLLAVTARFYPCFRLRLTGAGDVKLLGAVAAWSGTDRFLLFLFFSFLTASVPAALLLARKMVLEEAGRSAPKSGSLRIPMGPFFLAGWLITVSMLNGGSLWQIIPQGGR